MRRGGCALPLEDPRHCECRRRGRRAPHGAYLSLFLAAPVSVEVREVRLGRKLSEFLEELHQQLTIVHAEGVDQVVL